jgi:3-polyprenyl-4-hydroxybenzoate decarboxylase
MGIDTTHKWPQETDRCWGTTTSMSDEVKARVDAI